MSTTNVTVTHVWGLAVSSAVSDVLLSVAEGAAVEIATTASDATAPTVLGHVLRHGEGVTRDLIGSGAIWARALQTAASGSSATLAVNA